MPSVFRRKTQSGTTYYAKLFEGGRLVHRSTGADNKPEAERRAREMQAVIDGGGGKRGFIAPEQAWQEYEHRALQSKRERTVRHERMFWDMFWRNCRRGNVCAVTAADAEHWRNSLQKTPSRNGGSRSAHTICDALRAMATVYATLQALGCVQHNPFTADQCVRPRKPKGRQAYLTSEELSITIQAAAASGRDVELLVALGLYAGLRKGETLALRWRDIDWDRRGQGGEAMGCLYVWESDAFAVKTSSSNRAIPLHPTLRATLNRHRPPHGGQNELIVRPGATTTLADGYRWNTRRAFERISKAVGRRVTPHMLRHTFASQLAQRGVRLEMIGKWLGHSSVTTTEIYAHLCPISTEIGRL